jgi:hypothetical protein
MMVIIERRKLAKFKHLETAVINRKKICYEKLAVPWLRRLVAGLSPRRPGFVPSSVYVGFVVNNGIGTDFFRVVWFSRVSIIPS